MEPYYIKKFNHLNKSELYAKIRVIYT